MASELAKEASLKLLGKLPFENTNIGKFLLGVEHAAMNPTGGKGAFRSFIDYARQFKDPVRTIGLGKDGIKNTMGAVNSKGQAVIQDLNKTEVPTLSRGFRQGVGNTAHIIGGVIDAFDKSRSGGFFNGIKKIVKTPIEQMKGDRYKEIVTSGPRKEWSIIKKDGKEFARNHRVQEGS